MKKIGIIVISIIMISIIVLSFNKKIEYNSNFFYMDTYISVKIFSNNKNTKKHLEKIEDIFKTYHQLTDRYNKYESINNVYYINTNIDNIEKIKIDKKLYELLEFGLESHKQSNGLLDINIGGIVDIWKNYRENSSGIPSIEELKNTSKNPITLLPDNYILNNKPNIDLGSLAKGYTVKIANDYLKQNNIKDYIINAGGNVVVGTKREKYKVGIENPTNSELLDIVLVNNKSVVTSGSYKRFYTYNGKTYSHILDPKTMFPSEYMKSVSVICDESHLADYMSTTLFLMPISDAIKFSEKNNCEAIFYTINDEIIKTKGYSKYEQK